VSLNNLCPLFVSNGSKEGQKLTKSCFGPKKKKKIKMKTKKAIKSVKAPKVNHEKPKNHSSHENPKTQKHTPHKNPKEASCQYIRSMEVKLIFEQSNYNYVMC